VLHQCRPGSPRFISALTLACRILAVSISRSSCAFRISPTPYRFPFRRFRVVGTLNSSSLSVSRFQTRLNGPVDYSSLKTDESY
jgi:hypothetical protein